MWWNEDDETVLDCARTGHGGVALVRGNAHSNGIGGVVNRSVSDSPVVASVAGSTHVLLGPATFGVTVQQDPLAYDAVRLADGRVGGHWRYDYYEAGVHLRFSGRVTCLACEVTGRGSAARSTRPPTRRRSGSAPGDRWRTWDRDATPSCPTGQPSSASGRSRPRRHTATPRPTRTSSSTCNPAASWSKTTRRQATNYGPSVPFWAAGMSSTGR